MLENPRIFVFVIGGLTHHEMCSITILQETLNAQIIPGSNEIVTPKEFLTQLENLHKKENDSHFVKAMESGEAFSKDDDDSDNELEDDDTKSDTYAINF